MSIREGIRSITTGELTYVLSRAVDAEGASHCHVGKLVRPFRGCLFGVRVFLVVLGLQAGVATVQAQTAPYLDANGWTTFTPSSDTQTIYVSSSAGNDNNNGLAQNAPVKTLAKGVSLLRMGYPDWLLVKKGDTWTEPLNVICVSGRSAIAPMLISSYGSGARPLLNIATSAGSGISSFGGGGCGAGGNFLALVGIEFYAYDRDPSSPSFNLATIDSSLEGTSFLNPISWLLIENCKFSFFDVAIDIDSHLNAGPSTDVSIRRNVVVDSYGISAHSQGIFLDTINNLLIEENLFDHNGWNATVPGASATIFNHNMYVQYTNGPATVRGNISANASSHGSQVRPGGTVTNNLFVHNPIALLMGSSTSTTATLGPNIVSNNAIMEGVDLNLLNPRGFGIDVNPNIPGIQFQLTNNIIAHEASAFPYGYGITLESGTTGINATGNIIYQWDNPIIDNGSGNTSSPNAINQTGYPNPNATVETYDATLGGPGTLADFLARARLQSKDTWNTQLMASAVNAYVQAGFGVTLGTLGTPLNPIIVKGSSAPAGAANNSATSSQAQLLWNASPNTAGIAGYNVYRNGTNVGSTSTTSYQDSGLASGSTYTYTVSAYDAAGNTSARSSAVSITTPSPPSIAISSPTDGTHINGDDRVDIVASGVSPNEIASITITADRNILLTCTSVSSCSATWEARNISRGTHVIGATVVDKLGLQSRATVGVLAIK